MAKGKILNLKNNKNKIGYYYIIPPFDDPCGLGFRSHIG